MLTGKDTDEIILSQLNDKDLASACKINRRAREFCSKQQFWRKRIVQFYGEKALPQDLEDYREFYQSGKVKTYSLCRSIPHRNQLVVEDFYDPQKGFYGLYFTRDDIALKYFLLKIARDKYKSLNNNVMTSKLSDTIAKMRQEIPDYRLDDFSDSLNFTESDKSVFQKIIDIRIVAPELLRIKAKSNPEFVRAVSPDPIKTFRLLYYIHTGFRTNQLPLDILWSELCSHPYILKYSV